MTALDKQAREWLNKKHFTSDAGVTLDVIAMMPDEHALAINIRQLSQLLTAYGKTVATQVREQTVAECAGKWVSVAERLPEKHERVFLCADVDGEQVVDCGNFEEKSWGWQFSTAGSWGSAYLLSQVTHWMPRNSIALPAPPETTEQEER